MKRETGWFTAAAVAAGTLGIYSSHPKEAAPVAAAPVAVQAAGGVAKTATDKPFPGTCADLAGQLQHFLLLKQPPKVPRKAPGAVGWCEDPPDEATEGNPGERASLRVVVATMPDPVHTHLGLSFDRGIAALEQAAADEGYIYDSSWMPWKTDDLIYHHLRDEDEVDQRSSWREDQPGLLLFRKPRPTDDARWLGPRDSVLNGLAIFVVGEEPTAGVHRQQFLNAMAWIQSLRSQQLLEPRSQAPGEKAPAIPENVGLLAPSSSGALPSLEQLLAVPGVMGILRTQSTLLHIYSGEVSSGRDLDDFAEREDPKATEVFSFQEDDQEVLRRYCSTLPADPHLAVIAEDQTAYGAENESVNGLEDPARCVSLQLYYPRDIAALRAAYQKQGLFDSAGTQPENAAAPAPRRFLQSDVADTLQDDHDAVRSYGGPQTALSQEAMLMQLVNKLNANHVDIVVLESTNALDQLFLARFFKQTYPRGRIAILGNDLLLRREVGHGGLTGILTLDTYPLLPDIGRWTLHGAADPGVDRLYSENDPQGDYFALRFLLRGGGLRAQLRRDAEGNDAKPLYKRFLPNNVGEPIPGYASPVWLKPTAHPATWVSVLTMHGFWAVAALDNGGEGCPCTVGGSLGAIARRVVHALHDRAPLAEWVPVPVASSTRLAMVGLLLFAVLHLLVCSRASLISKPHLRSYFVRPHRGMADDGPAQGTYKSHMALVVLSSALLASAAAALATGYGWLSCTDAPVPNPGRYALYPMLIWLLGAGAVFLNACNECRFGDAGSAATTAAQQDACAERTPRRTDAMGVETLQDRIRRIGRTQMAVWGRPILCYLGVTALFTVVVLMNMDHALTDQTRAISYLRAMNLLSGVSPTVPLILLLLGLYAWCWFSLRGLSLFGADRPRLPLNATLPAVPADADKPAISALPMLSHEFAGAPIERWCLPVTWKTVLWTAVCLTTLLCGVRLLFTQGWVPFRSLAEEAYAFWVWALIALNVSLLIVNTGQLYGTWHRLRSVLMMLDKLPLRRTMQSIHGFTWGSIWTMGSHAAEQRYKMSYQLMESTRHLLTSLDSTEKLPDGLTTETVEDFKAKLGDRTAWRQFARWRAENWDQWRVRDVAPLERLQKQNAQLAGDLMRKFLLPVWLREKDSLLVSTTGQTDGAPGNVPTLAKDMDERVRNAEEVVCLVYLSFVQNILARIRSLVFGITLVFIAIALVLPSYPFDPRPVLMGAVTLLFLGILALMFTVFSQMFRDATLSHLTNTEPGKLGSEFWVKFLGFGIGPLLGLLATLFPSFSDVISSLLQPGISMLK